MNIKAKTYLQIVSAIFVSSGIVNATADECGRSYIYAIIQVSEKSSQDIAVKIATETLVRIGYKAQNDRFVFENDACYVLIERSESSIQVVPYLSDESTITAAEFSNKMRAALRQTIYESNNGVTLPVLEEIMLH